MKKITLTLLTICLCFTGITTAQTFLISEDFQSVSQPNLPSGWTTQTLGTDAGFTTGTDADANSGGFWPVPAHGVFVMTNDDQCNCNKSADYLIFPSVSLTGLTGAQLSFTYVDDRTYGGTGGSVEMNINGTASRRHDSSWFRIQRAQRRLRTGASRSREYAASAVVWSS